MYMSASVKIVSPSNTVSPKGVSSIHRDVPRAANHGIFFLIFFKLFIYFPADWQNRLLKS